MIKEYDAVKEMRFIRKKLQKEFEIKPGLRRKRMEQIRKKYQLIKQTKELVRYGDELCGDETKGQTR